MKKFFFATVIIVISINTDAQTKKNKDIKAIKSMCGCYEVSFNFAETFNYSKDSTYKPSETKHDKGLEWVELVEESSNKIVLQHLLITGKPSEPAIVKHWRQDWIFENTNFYMFDYNNKWNFIQKSKEEVSGQWTQKVYQVDDSPRYEGTATWVHVDGKSFWENTTDAPLPRREHTKRDDYNVTVRSNRHEITNNGWIHDEDNDKVIRKSGEQDVVLAEEKGFNTYVKVEDIKCKAAQDWWKENKKMWSLVRNVWGELFAKNQNLALNSKVDDTYLFQYLFKLEPSTNENEIKKIITSFVK